MKASHNFILMWGDNFLINGHRLSEWCGHGPVLEEDLALSNLALGSLGQAQLLLDCAGKSTGQNADELAYFRDTNSFHCQQLLELPRGDFAFTVVRQFFFSAYVKEVFSLIEAKKIEPLCQFSGKLLQEFEYHWQHSSSWLERLSLGTQESKKKILDAVEELTPYAYGLFHWDDEIIDPKLVKESWLKVVNKEFEKCELPLEKEVDNNFKFTINHSRHTEHLGYILADMQTVARNTPQAVW